jgi:hypothetical protein
MPHKSAVPAVFVKSRSQIRSKKSRFSNMAFRLQRAFSQRKPWRGVV